MSTEGKAAGEAVEHVIAKAVEEAGVRESKALTADATGAVLRDAEETAARDAARPAGGWFPESTEKIPEDWSGPNRSKKFRRDESKPGYVWRAPEGQDGVRIDMGNPASPYPSQQVDHVVVNSRGRIVGRDGELLPPGTRVQARPDEAHIPLSEWKDWGSWNAP